MKREVAEERLFDVLLEEELGAARRREAGTGGGPARRAERGRWLAAALVLLGVGVVAAAVVLQRRAADAPRDGEVEPAAAPQDPQPVEIVGVVPHSREDFAALLDGLRTVRVHSLRSPDSGGVILTTDADGTLRGWRSERITYRNLFFDEPPLGAARYVNVRSAGTGSRSPSGAPDPLAVLVIRERGEVDVWMRDLRDSSSDPPRPGGQDLDSSREYLGGRTFRGFAGAGGGSAASPPLAELTLELADGRTLGAIFDLEAGVLRCGESLAFQAGAALRQRIDAAARASERNGRLARGIVASIEELRLLPASTRSVECPWPTADQVRRDLARLATLERLALVLPEAAPAPTREALVALGELGSLRALHLRVDGLLAEVGALAGLRLEELQLAAPQPRDTDGQQGVEAERSGVRDLLPRLASLRTLALAGPAFGDADVESLLLTKVERLQLVGTMITAAGVRRLAELPSLRELEIGFAPVDEAMLASLGTLTGLRRLAIASGDAQAVQGLREKLPACEVVELAGQGAGADPFGRGAARFSTGLGGGMGRVPGSVR